MTCSIKTEKLNDTGFYVSALDWDDSFKDKDNPEGYFIMIIEPLAGRNAGIIYYQKTDDGCYIVEGEGYILTGTKSEIKEKKAKRSSDYKQKKFKYVERV